MAKATKQQEALQLLDDLDNLPSSGPCIVGVKKDSDANTGEEADVLAFIDELTQKSAESTKSRLTVSRPASRSSNPPLLRKKSTEFDRTNVPIQSITAQSIPSDQATIADTSTPTSNNWTWNNMWTTTTAALQQARSVVDDQIKTLSQHEQARKIQEGAKGYVSATHLEKLSKFRGHFYN